MKINKNVLTTIKSENLSVLEYKWPQAKHKLKKYLKSDLS